MTTVTLSDLYVTGLVCGSEATYLVRSHEDHVEDEPEQPPAQHPVPRQYRQGDVFLLECDPAETSGAQWERPADGRLVLALGEATGHAHAIRAGSRAGLRGRDGKRWLEAMEPVMLEHEEHGPITVEPGTYRIRIQREFVAPRGTRPSLFGAVSTRRVLD